MTSRDAYIHLKSLTDSIGLLTGSKEELLLFIATAVFRASRPLHQRGVMDCREIQSFNDLNKVALTFSASESEKVGRYQSRGQECYKCHKFGHRAFECRSYVPSNSSSVSHSSSNNNQSGSSSLKPPGIVCYMCREPGHKSPDCPYKAQNKGGDSNAEYNKKLHFKRGRGPYHANLAEVKNKTTHVIGVVNGEECPIVADTGAEITIVPSNLVYEGQITDEVVEIRDWQDSTAVLSTAAVEFVVAGKKFSDLLAVAPADALGGKVLYSVPVNKETATKLLLNASPDSPEKREGQGRDTRSIQTPPQPGAGSVDSSGGALGTPQSLPDTPEESVARVNVVTRSAKRRARKVKFARMAKEITESELDPFDTEFSCLSNIDVDLDVNNVNSEVVSDEVDVNDPSVVELGGSSVEEEKKEEAGMVVVEETAGNKIGADESGCVVSHHDLDLGCPLPRDLTSSDLLIEEVRNDVSLVNCRALADKNLNGYQWKEGLKRVVLPKCRRLNVLKLAHDKTAHIGSKGIRKLIGQRFTWPGVYVDIVDYVRSCESCLRMNQSGHKKSKMVERGIVTVPFETVAVDVIGPLPKGKRGAKFVFTYICLASRWPEAVPMRSTSAREAAQCFLEIVSRTGIPLKVLSDRGLIFLSKLMNGMYEMLGIDAVSTSPYRPQSNGVVERMHGTLKPMLTKAADSGIMWVEFLPLALFALRQVPSTVTGFSPHKLVFGREVTGPLDILYSGWVNCTFEGVDTEDWLMSLNDKLATIHDIAVAQEAKSVEARVIAFNKGKVDRELDVGAKVLMRIPGLHGSLQASWEGPYVVTSRVSKVTYKVSKGEGHSEKIVHVNNLKVFKERTMYVNAVTIPVARGGSRDSVEPPFSVTGSKYFSHTPHITSGI